MTPWRRPGQAKIGAHQLTSRVLRKLAIRTEVLKPTGVEVDRAAELGPLLAFFG